VEYFHILFDQTRNQSFFQQQPRRKSCHGARSFETVTEDARAEILELSGYLQHHGVASAVGHITGKGSMVKHLVLGQPYGAPVV